MFSIDWLKGAIPVEKEICALATKDEAIAAAIASSLVVKTQISFSTGMAPFSQSIENTAGSSEELWTRQYEVACLLRIRPRQFPRCPVCTIIGGELLEIPAECQCYHGNTTSKREQERQRYEGLHV